MLTSNISNFFECSRWDLNEAKFLIVFSAIYSQGQYSIKESL